MGGRNFEEEFGQALFFVSPTPHYVARKTKIEPDRRLLPSKLFSLLATLHSTQHQALTIINVYEQGLDEAKSHGWVGRGSCLFEDKKKDIYLLPQCSVQICLRSCLFREFPVVD